MILSAGFTSLEAGIDYGLPADLIADNQDSLAINTTYRGGYPSPRPGVRKVPLQFPNDFGLTEVRFKGGIYQRFGYYDPGSGQAQVLMGSIGGNFFRIDPLKPFCEILPDPGPQQRGNQFSPEGWCVQADSFWIFQNRVQAPVIWDGTSLRRAHGGTDTPQGTAMAYEFGRLWVARGLEYFAGDIVGGGTPVTSFTENQYLNEGGSFFVPSPHGEISAMRGIANLNTALGTSDLAVYTQNGMWLNACPPDRTTWKNTAIQRVGLQDNGALNQDVVSVNGDHWFRAEDGWRSGVMSVRNFSDEGNVPQSGEIRPILDADSPALLQFGSATKFDNRLMMTVSPVRSNQGIFHRGLAVLDFDLVSQMRRKLPPAFEGVWVFDRILQVISGRFGGEQRCYAFVLNISNEIELWEISRSEKMDNWDTLKQPISWGQESKKRDFGYPDVFKKLQGSTEDQSFINIENMEGRVRFNIYYRPDDNPCWQFWHGFSEEAKASQCPPTSCLPTLYQPQGRKPLRLPQPADTCDPVSGRPTRTGYAFQTRTLIEGYCTLKRFMMKAEVIDKEIRASAPCLGDAPPQEVTCCNDPFAWDSYGVLGPVVGTGGGTINAPSPTIFTPPPTIPPTPPVIPPTPPPIGPPNPDVNPNRDLSGTPNPGTLPGAIQYCSIWVFPWNLHEFDADIPNQYDLWAQFAYRLLRNEFRIALAQMVDDGTLQSDNQGNALDSHGVPILYQVPALVAVPAPTVIYVNDQPVYLGIGNARWTPFNNGQAIMQQDGLKKYATGNPMPDNNVDPTLVTPITMGNKMCLWYFM